MFQCFELMLKKTVTFSTNMVPFGKYRGTPLTDVPKEYLRFLTCWKLDSGVVPIWQGYTGRNYREKVAKMPESPQVWLVKTHPAIVWEARKLWESRRWCFSCGRHLVAVGTSRENGKCHADWGWRKLHKKCYRELVTF